ncbi:hypothetical protein QFC19_003760 [Naganishia cerealis]|uniref:Uncharacterized protein n=1 Tax=Naganishia cerealis TaxID=610337 RepID=A0ACC2VZW8_9TREE|nr:hypothetical protein QFC19_003760 [Naganishia cerealis]
MSIIDGFQNIHKVLIANRGEIACRIIKSCQQLGLTSIAIYSQADRSSLHVRQADEAWLLPGKDSEAYIDEEAVLEIAKKTGAHAVVPGYGFLSENAEFADRVENEGLVWVGPSANVIRQFGLKHTARELAIAAGVPVVQGTDLLSSADEALEAAERIGYPIMLKATAGGGGMGLQICYSASEIRSAFQSVLDRGSSLFKNSSMFMEKYIAKSRHIEVQVFGNGQGEAVHFNERECSVQRRHQKVVEECPSPFVERTPVLTWILSSTSTRLQVEHGITESCHSVDLVSLMLQQAEMQTRSARGGLKFSALQKLQKPAPIGYAIESRIYAEIPSRNFAPSPGLLQNVEWYSAEGVRIDTWITSGTNISPYYDPMIAKVIVYQVESHDKAVESMLAALRKSKVQGCPTNIQYLAAIVDAEAFRKGDTTTAFLTSDAFRFTPCTIDVLFAGTYTTVQDWPARLGVGHGIPEAGPMDSLSFRLANIIAGNPEGTEGLEVTLIGPELLFNVSAIIAVTGGTIDITIDGKATDMYTRLLIPAGSKVKLGMIKAGCRSYIAIKGGLPAVPSYLGSKSTTSTLGLGGYQGRQLAPNDSLDLDTRSEDWVAEFTPATVPSHLRLDRFWEKDWTLYVMPGPHDEPEFVTAKDREIIYGTQWQISHNATRSGYRLRGPRLDWAPVTEFKESGSHGSNIIDEPYVLGSLNFNGDDAVLLPLDAPMAGGLATTTTVVRADLWRMGQCRPGDTIRFKRISWGSALAIRQRTEQLISQLRDVIAGQTEASMVSPLDISVGEEWDETILHEIPADETKGTVLVKYRQGGDCSIQVTYGPMTADVMTRSHIQQITSRITSSRIPGFVAVTATTRAYNVQFDPLQIKQSQMLQQLISFEESVGANLEPLPSRIFKFPILLDDPVSKAAVADYAATVRDSAVYLPSNMEYIAKANGVKDGETAAQSFVACPQPEASRGNAQSKASEQSLTYSASRLIYVAQKYNPVRAFTPEGTVGLGGPLLVIYPMASPGGYQFCGRTIAAWDAYAVKPGFEKPWLLNDFDQVQFYEVDQAGFDKCYEEFKTGRFHFEVQHTTFDPAAHKVFLQSIEEETKKFTIKRNAAGKAEGERENALLSAWREKKAAEDEKEAGMVHVDDGAVLLDLVSPMTASLWKVLVTVGEAVKAGQTLAILEAMKMEIHQFCHPDKFWYQVIPSKLDIYETVTACRYHCCWCIGIMFKQLFRKEAAPARPLLTTSIRLQNDLWVVNPPAEPDAPTSTILGDDTIMLSGVTEFVSDADVCVWNVRVALVLQYSYRDSKTQRWEQGIIYEQGQTFEHTHDALQVFLDEDDKLIKRQIDFGILLPRSLATYEHLPHAKMIPQIRVSIEFSKTTWSPAALAALPPSPPMYIDKEETSMIAGRRFISESWRGGSVLIAREGESHSLSEAAHTPVQRLVIFRP